MKNNDKTKKIIAFLDKDFPPSHSFVDGMLSTVLPSEKDLKVELVVSGNSREKVSRYKKALCLPLLFQRRGIYRFLNFFKAIVLLKKLIRKSNNEKIVLFVRNEPIYLLACCFVKQKDMKLIFQNSFPHENVSGNFIKRIIAKWMYKLSERKVDSLLTVSPKGLERIRRIFPYVQIGGYIPLLSDTTRKINNFELKGEKGKVRFIYIGDHTKPRKLEIVLKAVVKAFRRGLKAEFKFIGGSFDDIERLRAVDGVQKLEKTSTLVFMSKIPREMIWSELINADVGLSLIPPDEHYKEASPTKLTEYMGIGLAIVASYGIDLQEDFLQKSDAGVLCEWNDDQIADCLCDICTDVDIIKVMKKNGYQYAKNNLKYQKYINTFRELM